MEHLQNALYGLGVTALLGWIGWISLSTIQNRGKLIILDGSDKAMRQEMKDHRERQEEMFQSLKDSFADMKKEVKDDIGNLTSRMDVFLKGEIDALKDLAGRKR